ncbi:MAG: DUF4173 domain-containing protein [Eubacterium sp.]|nr:DUF4173 domain-containing protein [Eubacterium sp.]
MSNQNNQNNQNSQNNQFVQNGMYYTPAPQQPYYPQANYQPYKPIKKVYKPFEKKDSLFFLLSLIASFLMLDFGLIKGVKLGFTVAYVLLFCITTAYLWQREAVKNMFSLVCGALSLAGAVTFSLFDNMIITPIMFFLTFGLYGFYVLGISGTFTQNRGSIRAMIDLFYSVIIEPFAGLEKVIGSAKASSKTNKKLIGALIGIAVSVPFLAVIIPLLMSSDAAFEGLVKVIAKNIGVYLVEFAVAVACTPFVFSYLFSKREGKNVSAKNANAQFIASPVSVSFLSVISVTYVVYLLSQFAYFFTAFKGILPADYKYTASVFARRGFYEMFAVCVINVLIVSAVRLFTKREGGRGVIKALSCFISLFSVLLIVIAMQKMRLNISIYGLSVNRVLVCTLMVMILVMIAFFIVHIFAPKISYFQPIILICSALFIALTFANIDARCAEYNIRAYNEGRIEMLDTSAIRKSSDSAIPYLVEIAKGDDKVLSNNAKNQIVMYVENNDDLQFKNGKIKVDKSNRDPRSYNMARVNAYSAVKDYYDSLSEKDKEPMEKLDYLYTNGYYNEEENRFESYENDGYTLIYKYNPKTGLYDITEKD